MSLVVNNNMMAANTARNLNAHYGRLATSTQRLSSGLRVNSAADDAAGLAIRELQRADIAALHQGARNANDAISMIQVADGSLGIIDEKLIRMKELAEQAATGTYDSTQRLMIESEYQAMASEITRIANATDFNGMKLLDGTLDGEHDGSELTATGKMKIHFGTGNDSAEDYYYITIGDCTAAAFGVGNESTWQDVQERGAEALEKSLRSQIKNDPKLSDEDKGKLLAQIPSVIENFNKTLTAATDPKTAYDLWATQDDGVDGTGFLKEGKIWESNSDLLSEWLAAGAISGTGFVASETTVINALKNAAADARKKFVQEPLAIDPKIFEDTNDLDAAVAKIKEAVISEAKNQLLSDTAIKLLEDVFDFATTPANKPAAANAGDPVDDKAFDKLFTPLGIAIEGLATSAAAGTPSAAEVAATAQNAKAGASILNEFAKAANNAIDAKYAADDPKEMDTSKYATVAQAAIKAKAEELGIDLTSDSGQAFVTALDNIGTTNVITGGGTANTTIDQLERSLSSYKVKIAQELAANSDIAAIAAEAATPTPMEEFWNSLRDTQKQKLQYAWGHAAIYNIANAATDRDPQDFGIGAQPANFGLDVTIGEEGIVQGILDKALDDMYHKIGDMDFAGYTVETQEDAQHALEAINNAIVEKDKIRAHLGATQNRLENTVSNLNIQAENLQAAESRISDVDVATEMTQFVRNQILTQSAVAMLSQANSLPQMAMQLIGG